MSNLIKTSGGLAIKEKRAAVAHIMAISRVITPQFYKSLSDEDLKAEKVMIELLTGHIDAAVLRKMCELAVQNYGTARSDSNKTYWDINYILTFYRTAFNWIWCESIGLAESAKYRSSTYDRVSRIVVEEWECEEGIIQTIKYIMEEQYKDLQDPNSPKYFQMLSKRFYSLPFEEIF